MVTLTNRMRTLKEQDVRLVKTSMNGKEAAHEPFGKPIRTGRA